MSATELASRCDKCGEIVADIDAGFSPGLHAMGHECGGTWRRVRWNRDTGAAVLARLMREAGETWTHALDRSRRAAR